MRMLLDTHSFLWFVNLSPDLTAHARSVIEDDASEVYLSIVSAWEIAIKTAINKLHLPAPVHLFVPAHVATNDLLMLPIELSHLGALTRLPFHHKDPFDRLLIAQAIAEQMPIISADEKFDAYGVQRIWEQ